MNKYETVVIIRSKESEETRKEILEKIKNFINKKGKVESIEELGLKKLAYEIKGNKEAYYYLINFEMEPDGIYELERFFRITEEIIKFIVVRKDD